MTGPTCPICAAPSVVVNIPGKGPRTFAWCGQEHCFRILAMDGFDHMIRKLNEGPVEECVRLQTVIRRLLAGMKDARYWSRTIVANELQGGCIPNPEAAITALEKAAMECGLEIPS